MTRRLDPEPVGLLARLAGGSLAAAVLLGVLAWWWHRGSAGSWQAAQLGLAGGLVGAWFGSLPPALLMRGDPQRQASGALAGLGVRFFVTALLALVLSETIPETRRADRLVMLVWIGIAQFVLLGVDVGHQIRLVRRLAA